MELLLNERTSIGLASIPPGEFRMGSPNAIFCEAPPRPVEIRSGFYLGRTPITQAQWSAVMGGPGPWAFPGPDHPADSISWDDADEFCRALSHRCGRVARLPSEAEWEYACRAGSAGEYFFGPADPFNDESEISPAIRGEVARYAWFDANSGGSTRPVGRKSANPWGLSDIIGNVWEWCRDVWHGSYAGAPSDGSPWMDGEGRQPRRCLRGGAWDMNAFRCRSSYRSYDWKDLGTSRFGFRIALDP